MNNDRSKEIYATLDADDILGTDPGITVEAVAPHMATCAQCGKAAAISHIVRVFCTEDEFVEYDLCYRCANQNIDLSHLISHMGPNFREDNVGHAQRERVDIYWSLGKRAA